MTKRLSAKEKIIVALDVPDAAAALRLVAQLAGDISFFKVGLELFTRCGPEIVSRVRDTFAAASGGARCGVFLDLKLHDIPNTVAGAVSAATVLDVDFLTVHLAGGAPMLRAAVAAAGERMLLLGVSVLTSIDEPSLAATGVPGTVGEQVLRLAHLGMSCGLCGVVASPLEIALLRRAISAPLTLVIPGVRPAAADGSAQASDDQQRVMSPAGAFRAGADFLVIGRPITAQPDPAAAAGAIVRGLVDSDAAA